MGDGRPRRVAVIGGGPGGLFFAALLRRRYPRVEVVVHERNELGATFGFGVGLTGRARSSMAQADPEIFDELMAVGVLAGGHEFRLPSGVVRIDSPAPLFQIGRAALLDVLARTALGRGAEISTGSEVAAADLDADLVVAADGANSATRRSLAGELGAQVSTGEELYLWCGADFALDRGVFAPIETPHGAFVAHAYPYSADRSTFLIETDAETWRSAGFADTTAALGLAAPDASDEVSIAYLQEHFAEHLEGGSLLGNRTRWLRFPTIRAERWHHGRTVLLGDAIHTAHYSVGSGTKLAIEDAIALVDALDFEDLPGTFGAFEARRRPVVRRLQKVAQRSQLWWRTFPQRLDRPGAEIAVSYMTRAGAVSLDQLCGTNSDLVGDALGALGPWPPSTLPRRTVARWILEQPIDWGGGRTTPRVLSDRPGRQLQHISSPTPELIAGARAANGGDPIVLACLDVTCQDPQSDEAGELVDVSQALIAAGADGVCLTGPPMRDAVIDRAGIAERLRGELSGRVLLQATERDLDLLAASIASGRADAVIASAG